MPLLARLVAGILRMPVGEGRALVFTAVTRNSLVVLPLALALPAGYELAPGGAITASDWRASQKKMPHPNRKMPPENASSGAGGWMTTARPRIALR